MNSYRWKLDKVLNILESLEEDIILYGINNETKPDLMKNIILAKEELDKLFLYIKEYKPPRMGDIKA